MDDYDGFVINEKKHTGLFAVLFLILGLIVFAVLLALGIVNFKVGNVDVGDFLRSYIPIKDKENNANTSKDTIGGAIDTDDVDMNDHLECSYEKYSQYLFKVRITNKNGAKVFSWDDELGEIIQHDQVVEVYADRIAHRFSNFYSDYNDGELHPVGENKKYFDLIIDKCGNKTISYADVEIVEESIVMPKHTSEYERDVEAIENIDEYSEQLNRSKEELIELYTKYRSDDAKRIYYVHDDAYLYDGPGLIFLGANKAKKIPKGTYIEVTKSTDLWLYVTYEGYSGWLLKPSYMSEGNIYENIKFYVTDVYEYFDDIKTTTLEELGTTYASNGDETIEYNDADYHLYVHPYVDVAIDKVDESILVIPKNSTVTYDYYMQIHSVFDYHVTYDGKIGWIRVIH